MNEAVHCPLSSVAGRPVVPRGRGIPDRDRQNSADWARSQRPDGTDKIAVVCRRIALVGVQILLTILLMDII